MQSLTTPRITFFMIVTDRDAVIADYSIRSYAKIRGVAFKLVVYSNWLTSALKKRYFERWKSLPFVAIWENPAQRDELKPTDTRLWGPFELGYRVWDRELKKLDTPYHATVDADFEIVDGRFVNVMLETLDQDPQLIAMSTDYTPDIPMHFDSYSNDFVHLNERWHTWFCIYKRAALATQVSHRWHEERVDGPVRRSVWDDGAYLQKALRELHGWRLTALHRRYAKSYIHYGAFSHNTDITEGNVGLYRRLSILRARGAFGRWDLPARLLGSAAYKLCFGRVDRSSYVKGWADTGGIDGL